MGRATVPPVIGAVLVGGASRRMGRPKADLAHPGGGTLAEHAVRILRDAGAREVWLLGAGGTAAGLDGVPRLDDARADRGPLGGLVAALERARGLAPDRTPSAAPGGGPWVLLLACDLPYVDAGDARALARAAAAGAAPACAPRRDGRWEPLFACYDAARVAREAKSRLAAGSASLQGLLDAVGAMEHRVRDPRRLDDWDTPDDTQRTPP